jgi:hypothetical protein
MFSGPWLAFHIGVVVFALIAWLATSEIALRILFCAIDLAGHKAPTEWAKRHAPDAQLAQNRNYLRLQISLAKRTRSAARKPDTRHGRGGYWATPASESPKNRTLPSLTSSPTASATSSIGTVRSTRC